MLDDTTAVNVECTSDDPSSGSEQKPADGRNDPYFGKLPFDWLPGVGSLIVGNGNSSNIRKDSQEAAQISARVQAAQVADNLHDKVHSDRFVLDEDREHDVDLEMHTESNTIDDVRFHPTSLSAKSHHRY